MPISATPNTGLSGNSIRSAVLALPLILLCSCSSEKLKTIEGLREMNKIQKTEIDKYRKDLDDCEKKIEQLEKDLKKKCEELLQDTKDKHREELAKKDSELTDLTHRRNGLLEENQALKATLDQGLRLQDGKKKRDRYELLGLFVVLIVVLAALGFVGVSYKSKSNQVRGLVLNEIAKHQIHES